jgi:hypothetical protein
MLCYAVPKAKRASGKQPKRKAASSDEDYGGSSGDDERSGRQQSGAAGKARGGKGRGGKARGSDDAKAGSGSDSEDVNKAQGNMTKEEKAKQAAEWERIQANPPPPEWKAAEEPGYYTKSEERSRRCHIYRAGTN